jgi:HEAT repeat protein
VIGCCALVLWACLRLYDYQHPAARGARGLSSLQAVDRIAAIRELEGTGRVDADVAIPALIKGLEDTDAEVRASAAMALVSVVPGVGGGSAPTAEKVRAALRALVGTLDDPQPAVRAVATRALWMVVLVNNVPSGQLELAPALVKALRKGDLTQRVAAAKALGRFHPGNAVFAALTELIGDTDIAVRLAALGAIHDIDFGAPFEIPKSMGTALEDESAEVRTAAAAALWRSKTGIDPYIAVLIRHAEHDPNARVREVCEGKLSHLAGSRGVTPAVLPDLIQALERPGTTVRFLASEILAGLGPAAAPAVPALIRSMRKPDASRPWANPGVGAAKALGKIAQHTVMAEKAITGLIEASRADDPDVKHAALEALAALGGAAPSSN